MLKNVFIRVLALFVVLIVGALRGEWGSAVFFADESSDGSRIGDAASSFDEVLITPPTESCHCSTLVSLPDGNLFVAWYGGSREGAKDVEIYSSTIDKSGNASPIRSILNRSTLERQTGRYIRKLGNPVIYRQGNRLWLFVVSVSCGGWSGSSLNYAYSDDYGKSWSTFKHLRTNPLFNMGTLVRCPAVPLQDGGFILPAYRELLGKFSVAICFDFEGNMVGRVKIPIEGNRSSIQPCVVPLGTERALSFSRTPNRKIGASESNDGGLSWRALPDLPLDNPDSSVAALKTNQDQLVVVGNPREGRGRLLVWTNDSFEEGRWQERVELENSIGDEFSYPSVCKVGVDYYVSYTYKRRGIKIVNMSRKLDSMDVQDGDLKN
ncbi:MAG: exo-alpha-sialidase [Thermoguttaceae bacterium]|nr:exo-alpha-sialidase [Thermoguttaceae bacterium]